MIKGYHSSERLLEDIDTARAYFLFTVNFIFSF